jgi:hypothetical protein
MLGRAKAPLRTQLRAALLIRHAGTAALLDAGIGAAYMKLAVANAFGREGGRGAGASVGALGLRTTAEIAEAGEAVRVSLATLAGSCRSFGGNGSALSASRDHRAEGEEARESQCRREYSGG